MSWRRFSLLVRCLSPNSATIAHITAGNYIGSGKNAGERVRVIDTPKAAQSAFEAMYRK
jgi:hypothetical protein